MLEPSVNPQDQPFLFQRNDNDNTRRPRSHGRHESSWDSMNHAFRAQKTAQGFAGTPGSPRRSEYRSMSPASRTAAIERGQRELMEMVSNMPESCYELSLKDLVEHSRDDDRNDMSSEAGLLERRSSFSQDDVVSGHRAPRPKTTAPARSSGSMETNGSGHLLKMGFPVSFGSKNRAKKRVVIKRNSTDNNNNNNNNNNSVVDKEWWKKRYSVTGGGGGGDQSSSGGGSGKSTATTSSSSGSRSSSLSSQNSTTINTRRGNGGCWWFIGKKKSTDLE